MERIHSSWPYKMYYKRASICYVGVPILLFFASSIILLFTFWPEQQVNAQSVPLLQPRVQSNFEVSDSITDSGMRAFQMFMDSFANSIFNGSSVFGAAGISLVDGIKVSGINFQNNINGSRNDQVTVCLNPDSSIVNNNTSSVTIIALRVPVRYRELNVIRNIEPRRTK